MDKAVSARFYRVTVAGEGEADFPDLLLALMNGTTPAEREREIWEGLTLRLEECTKDGDFLVGQFCRKQTEHLPPTAEATGVEELLEESLAHLVAFAYHIPTRVFLLQSSLQSATPNRIGLYLARAEPPSFYVFEPVLREDAWERFETKRIRSYSVTFAKPENLEAIEDEDLSVIRAAKLIAQASKAPVITISVDAGRRGTKDLPRDPIHRTIRKLLGSSAEIKKLSARTVDEDGDTAPINFIEDHMKASSRLELPKKDAKASYIMRRDWMLDRFRENLPYLERQFRIK